MNRTRAQLLAGLAALVLFAGGAAHAQAPATPPPAAENGAARPPEAAPPAPPPPAPEGRGAEARAHVRSSHTVDVIAPGEQVDTILGRMRVERPSPPPRGDAVRPPPGQESHGPRGQEPRRALGPAARGRRVRVKKGVGRGPMVRGRPLLAAAFSASTMMLASMLTLVVMRVAADPLAEAKQSFSEGRYTEAEQQALQAAQPPRLGAALYLVGLAPFAPGGPPRHWRRSMPRNGRRMHPRARSGVQPGRLPLRAGALRRGRAGLPRGHGGRSPRARRLGERGLRRAGRGRSRARRTMGRASETRRLRAGGRAGGGAARPRRTRAGERWGREAPREDAYMRGLAAFDAGRFEEARKLFLEDAEQHPELGPGAAHGGGLGVPVGRARDGAGRHHRGALAAAGTPGQTDRARLPRPALLRAARGRTGFQVSVGGGLGFDSNVLQVGVAARDVSTSARTASPFAEAGLGLLAHFRLSDELFADLSYGGTSGPT